PELATVPYLMYESWRLYRQAFNILIGYSAWMIPPYLLLVVLMLLVPQDQILTSYVLLYIIISLIQGIVVIWITNALILTVNKLAAKEQVDTNEINRQSWRLITPLLMVALLVTLVTFGGLLLLIVPGVLFAIWFCFAQISVILDNKKGIDALSFSRSLFSNRFLPLLRRVIIGPLLLFIVYALIMAIVIGFGFVFSGNIQTVLDQEVFPLWPDILENLVMVFMLPIFLIYWTLLYRSVKESKI
ncbi:MAG: hypothetical protein V1695_04190, partial [Candidatus Uhrbacteria bacterium]